MGNKKLLKGIDERYDFFFEQSNDCFFITDNDGFIVEANNSGIDLLKYSGRTGSFTFFDLFYNQNEKRNFYMQLRQNNPVGDFKARLISKDKEVLHVLITAKQIADKHLNNLGFQIILKQSNKIKGIVTKAVADTQEIERKRFARDLHDNFGQQLFAIKLHLATMQGFDSLSEYKHILAKSDEIVDSLLFEIRSMCFNLIPKTLQMFGLTYAVSELCNRLRSNGTLDFSFITTPNFPALKKTVEVNVFRIIQEFVNNAIRHGGATAITIKMEGSEVSDHLTILLEDNGKGFKIGESLMHEGMGLKNIKTRVSLCNGDLKMESSAKRGTKFKILLPN